MNLAVSQASLRADLSQPVQQNADFHLTRFFHRASKETTVSMITMPRTLNSALPPDMPSAPYRGHPLWKCLTDKPICGRSGGIYISFKNGQYLHDPA